MTIIESTVSPEVSKSAQEAIRYDFFTPEVAADANPLFHKLRAEDPVHWSPQMRGWVLTRYDDITQALKDPRLSAASFVGAIDMLPEEQRKALEPLRASVTMWMGHTITEDHLRMQRLLKKYFTPANVEKLRPRAQAITDELIDAVAPRGEVEVISELAYPLPARVIAEMLGVPSEDRDLLPRWSRDLTAIFLPSTVETLLQSQKSVLEMSEYMRGVVAERRRAPKDDLISMFIAAQADGGIRNDEEILSNCVLLLFAGHETTATLISRGLFYLLEHQGEFARLLESPDLLPNAIEEILRYGGPAQTVTRLAMAPLEIHGKEIKANQLLYLALGAGNRDPEHYPDPDKFDIGRQTSRHLAFGQGSFYCLGAALARMEAQVCFSTMLRRLPGIRWGSKPPVWHSMGPFARALVSLPVSFDVVT